MLRLKAPPIESLSLPELLEELHIRGQYFSLISNVFMRRWYCRDQQTRDLLGIQPFVDSDGNKSPYQFTIYRNSYIGRAFLSSPYNSTFMEGGPNTLVILESTLDRLIRHTLEESVATPIERLHHALVGLKTLRPCYQMVVHRNCKDELCSKDHTAISVHNYPMFIVQAHLAIIRVMKCLWFLPYRQSPYTSRREVRRVWVDRLFQALQPLHSRLICPTGLQYLPESAENIPTVQMWVADMVFETPLDIPAGQAHFFISNALTWLIMLEKLNNGVALPHLFRAAGFFTPRSQLVHRDSGVSIVEELVGGISHKGSQHRILFGLLAVK